MSLRRQLSLASVVALAAFAAGVAAPAGAAASRAVAAPAGVAARAAPTPAVGPSAPATSPAPIMSPAPTTSPARAWSPLPWAAVDDFLYQLQGLSLRQAGASRFDLVVMDYSRDGTQATAYTAAQVQALRASSGGRKRVLAYMSIGEAEDYRWYWQRAWDADRDGRPDAGAPAWLGRANPSWPGNYKVRYWDPGWQALLFGSPDSYLDKILAAGFDGVYLDVVDAYEYWGPGGRVTPARLTAAQDMVDLVRALADYARVTKGHTDFAVFPQNGADLGTHPEYLQVVSGIGQEDTWYDGGRRQPLAETAYVVHGLSRFRTAGKLVLCVDYCRRPGQIGRFYSKARSHGFVPYATVRALDRLVVNAGHAPD